MAKEGKPRIESLEFRRGADTVQVSFRVADGLSEGVLERIESGIPVSFRHRVDIVSRRALPLWPAKVLARLRVETSVVYDSLNRRYELLRTFDLRRPKKLEVEYEEQRQSTESVDDVRAWMTELTDIPALNIPATGHLERLRVRVESTLGRRYVMYLFPSQVTASSERRLSP